MNLNVTDNDLGPIVNSYTSIITRQANTVMIVKDGETAVIGGILKKVLNAARSGWPGLMNVPVVNLFFSDNSRSEEVTELLVFITPSIVKRPPPAA
jgi:type IV pilus assembly protein PilQ